ncbi:MAG: hypothetical protein CM15mP74_18480 [Halieaceae bacterium]|nr:MAG: hypothetical protein CM15mP74_18480 [Halieaceae bacterium]
MASLFGSGAASAYAMDPEAQDGYFLQSRLSRRGASASETTRSTFNTTPGAAAQTFCNPTSMRTSRPRRHWEATAALYRRQLPADHRATDGTSVRHDRAERAVNVACPALSALPGGRDLLRAAPHEDINLLTLLPSADGPGLELQLRSGEWISVPNRLAN